MNDSKDARAHPELAKVYPINIGHVYAVEFSDGWVKVGRGRVPKDRIVSHQSASRMRGAVMTKSCVSPLLVDCKGAERELINLCATSGVLTHGNEWFSGVDFDVLSSAVTAGFDTATNETLAIHRKREDEKASRLLSAIQSSDSQVGATSKSEDTTDWSAALVHAKSLEQMFVNECYGGDLFVDLTGRGYTLFFLYAAIAFSQLSPMGIAELYASALEDSEACIGTIENLSAKAVAAFMEAA
jgi:nitrogen regulatory protein PII-like uncharacterized protein